MRDCMSRFFHEDSGATAIEYGLIATGIALVIIGAVNSIGAALIVRFNAAALAISP